ncbi:family 10 glycosylhydrolase [Carboxylicivirga linearis]|uniref:Family 10 glycosylhydrolase n=1 Tax=Carboxylicivirga linearis TaxID=1628157 RepID=A0ABS5K0U0_9BACT|nr:family 10 glycosylhydrolase [Carboxylicivirga linearis]MBS2100747.1 family 10 glycosylhydrolase [Carboxylicivirga linearis]
MKLHTLFIALISVLFFSCSPQKKTQEEDTKNWIWVHANKDRTVEEWTRLLKQYNSIGVKAILLGANTEVLERVIPLAHQQNIEVHAWMWTLNKNGDSIAAQHPDWFSVNRLGESCYDKKPYVGYYSWVCPSIPQVQEHILNKVQSLLDIEGVDGIHLDYVRYCDAILPKGLWAKYDIIQDKVYPQWDYGYNPSNIKLFKALYGYSPLDLDDPNTDENWVEFRLSTVTDLVNKIADLVHSQNKQLSAAVFPSPRLSRKMVYQPWDQWNLDAALPMIYHNFYEEDIAWIGETTADGVAIVDGKFPIYTGLFVHDLKEEDLKTATELAVKSGANGWCLFDANSFEKFHQSKID